MENAKKMYKRIYPEFPILNITQYKENYIIASEFPDGIFYFIVTDNSVSSSYDSLEDAKRHI